jgi:hypothetical protein
MRRVEETKSLRVMMDVAALLVSARRGRSFRWHREQPSFGALGEEHEL